MTLSLTDAIEAYYAANPGKRGDEDVPHVSDLAGCDRETWARRNGEPMLGTDTATRVKFDLGHAVEAIMERLLVESLPGYTLERGRRVEHGGIVGHLDFLLIPAEGGAPIVVEVKSTTFFPKRQKDGSYKRELPDEAQYHYRLQAAAYASMVGAEDFCVLVICRDSGMVAEFWAKAAQYADVLARRTEAVFGTTGPGEPMPPAEPPSYAEGRNGNWKCKYCRYSLCERNENVQALAVG